MVDSFITDASDFARPAHVRGGGFRVHKDISLRLPQALIDNVLAAQAFDPFVRDRITSVDNARQCARNCGDRIGVVPHVDAGKQAISVFAIRQEPQVACSPRGNGYTGREKRLEGTRLRRRH